MLRLSESTNTRLPAARPSKINMGCGASPTPGWLNLDNSPFCRLANFPIALRLLGPYLGGHRQPFLKLLQRREIHYANVAKRIPVPDRSVAVIYTSHMLDQLPRNKLPQFFSEVLRVLIPGGYLRVGVMDLRALAQRYVEGTIDANRFVEVIGMAASEPESFFTRLKFLLFGFRTHRRWIYDGTSLISLMHTVGFVDARVLPPGQSCIPDPGALCLDERFAETIFVEARKQ
jgi:methyltransferase family protein